MPFIPSIADFISFAALDPSKEDRCLYHLPDQRRRCKWDLAPSDRSDAIRLRLTIIREPEDPNILLYLRRYALLNCCRRWHQSRLEEFGLVDPLTLRWKNELDIMRSPSEIRGMPMASFPTVVPRPSQILEVNMSSSPRYDLRSQILTNKTVNVPSATPFINDRSVTFVPHKSWPPKSVASVLRTPLGSGERRSGSVYLFTRPDAPGFVKIGYTSWKPEARLNQWEKNCGYKPKLLASFETPNAKRVELLIHFELAIQWRKEVWCRRCAMQHMEWFEIETTTAKRAAGDWAEWMNLARPYDDYHYLKQSWLQELDKLESSARPITAEALVAIARAQVHPSNMSGKIKSETVGSPVLKEILDHRTITTQLVATKPAIKLPKASLFKPMAETAETSQTSSLSKGVGALGDDIVSSIAALILLLSDEQQKKLGLELERRKSITRDMVSKHDSPTAGIIEPVAGEEVKVGIPVAV